MVQPFPTSIGVHYRVLERLGGGAMGSVFLAEDTRPNSSRQVAIKIPATSRHWRAEYVRRVGQEIGILSALQHPNIVEILDSGQDAVYGPFIAMEYIKGASVRQLMARQPGDKLRPDEAVRIAADSADALAYAHARPEHIIHRDVKPDNILVRELDRRVKVTDFGLAAVLYTNKRAFTQWGTPDYIAPEQALGRGADERSDLYGLAATLYHMVTGLRPPPLGASVPQRPSLALVPGVFDHIQARWLDSVILSLMAYDPTYRRPARASDVAEVLRAILGLHPAPTFYPSPEDSAMIPALLKQMTPPREQPRQVQAPRPQPAAQPPAQAAQAQPSPPVAPPAQARPQVQPIPPMAQPRPPAQAVPFQPAPPIAQPRPQAVPMPPTEQVLHPPMAPMPLPPAFPVPMPMPQPAPGAQAPRIPQAQQRALTPPPMSAAPAPPRRAMQIAPGRIWRPAQEKGKFEYEFLAGGLAGLAGLVAFIVLLNANIHGFRGVLLPALLFWATGVVAGLLSPRGRRGFSPWLAGLAAWLAVFFGTAILGALFFSHDRADGGFGRFLLLLLIAGPFALCGMVLGTLVGWLILSLTRKGAP